MGAISENVPLFIIYVEEHFLSTKKINYQILVNFIGKCRKLAKCGNLKVRLCGTHNRKLVAFKNFS